MDRIEFSLTVNGLPVRAEYEKADAETVFLPLLRQFTDIQKALDRRVIVFLAAPPGLGKSTLAAFLERLSEEKAGITPLQAAGMDGFHHYASYLKSHRTVRDGEEILLDAVKGAPETFDVGRLSEYLERLRTERTVLWPTYDRTKHDVVDDGRVLNREIILLEGNYLLLSDNRWRALRRFADFTVYAFTDISVLKPRLIERKIMSGYSPEESEKFYAFSDGRNARLVLGDRPEADLYLEYKDCRWTKA